MAEPTATVIMADAEKAQETPKASKAGILSKVKSFFNVKKILLGLVVTVCLLAVMFGMGVLAARYADKQWYSDPSHVMIEHVDHGANHALVERGQDGVPVPISTQTALTTLYSISMNTHDVATVVETVTGTAYVTVPAEKPSVKISVATFETSSEVCEIEVITMTESFTVTVIPTPSESYAAASSALGDATVIGNPSIVTEVQTELSLTAGLPDATVSGNPDIVTNIETQYSISSGLPDATVPGNPLTVTEGQTEYSISSGLPDATVPGNPLTVTEDQTQYSISSGLPDATVSGNPLTLTEIQQSYSVTGSIYTVITVTDLFPPSQETSETVNEDLSTLTRTTTYQTTITEGHSTVVITVTDLCEDSAMSTVAGEAVTAVPPPASPTSTFTKVVFATSGPASTSTKAIYPPYPTANNTIASGPSGTVTVVPVPTTPVMVSGGSKKPEPRGWGGSNGTTNLGCLVMLVAVMMFLM